MTRVSTRGAELTSVVSKNGPDAGAGRVRGAAAASTTAAGAATGAWFSIERCGADTDALEGVTGFGLVDVAAGRGAATAVRLSAAGKLAGSGRLACGRSTTAGSALTDVTSCS